MCFCKSWYNTIQELSRMHSFQGCQVFTCCETRTRSRAIRRSTDAKAFVLAEWETGNNGASRWGGVERKRAVPSCAPRSAAVTRTFELRTCLCRHGKLYKVESASLATVLVPRKTGNWSQRAYGGICNLVKPWWCYRWAARLA